MSKPDTFTRAVTDAMNPYEPPSDPDSEMKRREQPSLSRVWMAWASLSVVCFLASKLTRPAGEVTSVLSLGLFLAGAFFAMQSLTSHAEKEEQAPPDRFPDRQGQREDGNGGG